MSDENEKIEGMFNGLIDVLKKEKVWVGASAMICLLIESAQASGTPKDFWIKDMSEAWDHYQKERGKDGMVSQTH